MKHLVSPLADPLIGVAVGVAAYYVHEWRIGRTRTLNMHLVKSTES